jgi:hypothetical protein
MTQEDQFVPAEPGLKLAIWPGRRALTCPGALRNREAYLVPIVAWLMPGFEKYRRVKRKFNCQATNSPWPVTASGLHTPGSEPAAIVFPDGRAFEPGKCTS